MTTLVIIGALSMYGAIPSAATLEYRIENGQISRDAEADFYIALRDDYVGCPVTMLATDGFTFSYEGIVFDAAGHKGTSDWMNWRQLEGSNVIRADIAGEVDAMFADEHQGLIGSEVILIVRCPEETKGE